MRDKQRARRFVQDTDQDRQEAAAVVRSAFPGHLKVHRTLRYGISRARNGSDCNPVFRLRQWIRSLHATGSPRERAELLVADLVCLIEECWGTGTNWRAAMILEQQADSAEDEVQVETLVDEQHLPEWIERKKQAMAVDRVAIAAAERHLRNRGAIAA